MKKISIELKKTSELIQSEIEAVNNLKNQHWEHEMEEHMKWWNRNIKADDRHLLIWGGGYILAYLDLADVDVKINGQQHRMYGVGNVCVSKDHLGYGLGSLLMQSANFFLKEDEMSGILMCRESARRFYQRNGWAGMRPVKLAVCGTSKECSVFFRNPPFPAEVKVDEIDIDRNF